MHDHNLRSLTFIQFGAFQSSLPEVRNIIIRKSWDSACLYSSVETMHGWLRCRTDWLKCGLPRVQPHNEIVLLKNLPRHLISMKILTAGVFTPWWPPMCTIPHFLLHGQIAVALRSEDNELNTTCLLHRRQRDNIQGQSKRLRRVLPHFLYHFLMLNVLCWYCPVKLWHSN